jgi:hypothetical protein
MSDIAHPGEIRTTTANRDEAARLEKLGYKPQRIRVLSFFENDTLGATGAERHA